MAVEVHLYGDPVLREKGVAITQFDNTFKSFAQSVIDYVKGNDNSWGLAAQQAGQALRFFVIEVHNDDPRLQFTYKYDGKDVPLDVIMPMACVNPVIERVSDETDVMPESCLSFPGIHVDVERPLGLKMSFQDLDGNPHTFECHGICARVILHEYDHIEGTLFIDRAHPRDRKSNETKLKQLKRMTRDKMKKAKRKG